MDRNSRRTLTCRIWVHPDIESAGDSHDVQYSDVWSVSSGRSGKLYVDFGPTSRITIYEPGDWHRYEIVKTEKKDEETP